MIIKDNILIGGVIWDIIFTPNLRNEDDDRIYGLCDYSNYEIKINSDYPQVKQELALLHEIKHAICDMLGYCFDEKVKLGEQLIIGMQHYDHQVMLQIIEWQNK